MKHGMHEMEAKGKGKKEMPMKRMVMAGPLHAYLGRFAGMPEEEPMGDKAPKKAKKRR